MWWQQRCGRVQGRSRGVVGPAFQAHPRLPGGPFEKCQHKSNGNSFTKHLSRQNAAEHLGKANFHHQTLQSYSLTIMKPSCAPGTWQAGQSRQDQSNASDCQHVKGSERLPHGWSTEVLEAVCKDCRWSKKPWACRSCSWRRACETPDYRHLPLNPHLECRTWPCDLNGVLKLNRHLAFHFNVLGGWVTKWDLQS